MILKTTDEPPLPKHHISTWIKMKNVIFKPCVSRDVRIAGFKNSTSIAQMLLPKADDVKDVKDVKLGSRLSNWLVYISHLWLVWHFPRIICEAVLITNLAVISGMVLWRVVYVEDRWMWIDRFSSKFLKFSVFAAVLLFTGCVYGIFKVIHAYFYIGEYIPLFTG